MIDRLQFSFLPISAFILCEPPPVSAGETVPLRLEPDVAAATLESIDSEDERLIGAEPVLDPVKRAEGWQWIDFETALRGYVPLESVGKDLSVAPGTLVFLRTSETSPVLTTITEDDSIELVWASDWAEIQFTKAVPVYFRRASQPLPEITFDRPPVSAPQPSRNPEPLDSSGLYRYLDGILSTTGGQRASGNGKYPLQLVDKKGKRLAYMDTSNIVVSSSIDQFLNRPVTVYGAVSTIKKSGVLVIKAKTIRHKR